MTTNKDEITRMFSCINVTLKNINSILISCFIICFFKKLQFTNKQHPIVHSVLQKHEKEITSKFFSARDSLHNTPQKHF